MGGGFGGPGAFRTGGNASAYGNTRDPNGATRSDSARSGLQLGPPGRWWDDKHFAKSLKLRSDQQIRMDILFEQNRPTLYAQIDRIAQARAELEKANTHYLLQIRAEMDPDQIARLQQLH